MAETDIEKACDTLAEALTLTEAEISEEILIIQGQIEQLQQRILELNGRQETLAHDRQSIDEMYKRYCHETGQTSP